MVKLETAFAWTCPCCSSRNFVDGKLLDAAEIGEEEVREMMGLDQWEQIPEPTEKIQHEFIEHPDNVKCTSCGLPFVVDEV